MNLKIDNEAQTIQGVHIPNKNKFQLIRADTTSNYFEGWRPTKEDVHHLSDYFAENHPEEQAKLKKIWKEFH